MRVSQSIAVDGQPEAGKQRLIRIIDSSILWSLYACAGTIIISIVVAQGAALLAFLAWVIKITVVKGYRFQPSAIQIPFGIFVVARILSIPLSTLPDVSIVALRTEIFFYGLFFVVLHEFPTDNEARMKSLMRLFYAAAIFAAAYGSVALLTGAAPRAVSTTSGYYTLGMYLCTVLILAFPLGAKSVFIKPKWLWMAGSVVILFGLLLTYNRLHWAVAGLSLFLAGLVYDRKALIGLGVLGALMVFFLPDVGTRLDMLVHIGSNMSDRDFIWKGASMIWDQHPLTGFGLRTFREIFPLFDLVADKGIGSWHNDYLQVYIESGLMGLLPFLAMHGAIVFYGVTAWRKLSDGDPQRVVLGALLFTMIAFIVAGFIVDTLIHLLFFFLAGLIARISGAIIAANKPHIRALRAQ